MSQTREVAGEKADRPLVPYSSLMAAFLGTFGGLLTVSAARGRLPDRLSAYDLVLAGVAGHKLSRLIVTDEVTAPLRAPFVTVSENQGDVEEEPRGDGFRRAIGELVTCPSCVGQWATAGFVTGLLTAPRMTRAIGSIFVADAVSDFLHIAYKAGKDRA
jgi:hypothetical protein